jgi:hypothetical protein
MPSTATSIPEVFERQARAVLAEHPELAAQWSVISKGAGRQLFIPKSEPSGFDITVQAETYGLYPFAGDWHGAPWELSPRDRRSIKTQIDDLCAEFLGFVRTMLSTDATLYVHYSNDRPYRWVLSYETEIGPDTEECGQIVYNYFGKRRVETLRNRHLPTRYHRD